METVAEHFGIAEVLGGAVVPGHFYCYENEPTAHWNHVHVAYLPWREPDDAGARPPNDCPDVTVRSAAFRAEMARRFPWARWNGGCVYKHRNGDPTARWSAHAFGNADDFMAVRAEQDPIIAWIRGPWEEEDEDVNATKADYEQRAFNWGMKVRWQAKPRPTEAPDVDPTRPDENYLGAAQAGWDAADHPNDPPPVK